MRNSFNVAIQKSVDSREKMKLLNAIAQYYKKTALLLSNIVIFFVVCNLIIAIYYGLREGKKPQRDEYNSVENPVINKYGMELLESVYTNISTTEIYNLLDEQWSRQSVYDPYTLFKDGPYSGKYINISNYGFRVGLKPNVWPNPKDQFSIFIYGGSTTHGIGLPDSNTFPAFFEDKINQSISPHILVYNFGRTFYYSSQERILFEKHLVSGSVPQIAIFLDGLNEFYHQEDRPHYSNRLEKDFFPGLKKSKDEHWVYSLPLSKLADRIKRRLSFFSKNDNLLIKTNPDNYIVEKNDSLKAVEIISRYLANKRLIEAMCSEFQIQCFFIWQPIPSYKFDLKLHPFYKIDKSFGAHSLSSIGYIQMYKHKNEKTLNNFYWLADIQENENLPLYVDLVHYNAYMSNKIADTLYDIILPYIPK